MGQAPDFELIKELFDLPGAAAERAAKSTTRGKVGKTTSESATLGRQAMTEGDYESAVEHFKRAVEQSDETSPWPLMDLGAAYAASDQVPQAFRQYEKAKRIQKSGELMVSMAGLYRQMGRMNDAIVKLKEAVDLDPQDAYAHHKLAEALRKAGHRKEAVDAAQVAVACAPDQAFYHYWLGELLLECRQFEEAAHALHAAIELSPGDDGLYFLVSQAFWGQGKQEEAVRAVRLASDIDASKPLYHGLLRLFLTAMGLKDEAAQEDRKAKTMDAYDRDVLRRALERIGLRTA
ncbi:MAG: tetratricopeptide repeat protein [Armatimonadetes bacterium]|nr:tetratricopeptide repeat protein [Armatimonadota bacterium]